VTIKDLTAAELDRLESDRVKKIYIATQIIIKELREERDAALAENKALWRVADATHLIAYPRGFRDTNVPDDLHRALAALPKRDEKGDPDV